MASSATANVEKHTMSLEPKYKNFEENIMDSVEDDCYEHGKAVTPGLELNSDSLTEKRLMQPILLSDDEDDNASSDRAPIFLSRSDLFQKVSLKRTALDLEASFVDNEEDNAPVIRHVRRNRPSKCRRIILSDDEDSTPCRYVVKDGHHTVDSDDEYANSIDNTTAENACERVRESPKIIKSAGEIDEDDLPLIPALRLPRANNSTASNTDSDFLSDDYDDSNISSDASSILSTPTDSPLATSYSSPLSSPSPLSLSDVASGVDTCKAFEHCPRFLEEEPTNFFESLGNCRLFSEETDSEDTHLPLMTLAQRSVIIPLNNQVVSGASCLDRHPHKLDNAANDGDHLLVHLRPRNATRSKYAHHKPTLLDVPRGKVSLEVCPFAQPLDDAGEHQLRLVGKRVSSRATAARAIRDRDSKQDKQDYCRRQLTLEQNASKTYLSYHAVTLTNEDVRVLRNGWLTDNNITFWEEYLEREVLPKYPQARIALLRASLTLILMATDSIDAARKALPDFRSTTHIFLPISNAKDLSRSESGSHWSLLLVSIVDGVSFHYDSMGTSNLREARNVTARMAVLLGTPLRFRHIDDTPQQDNGNDCGVFVCVLMRFLLVKRLLNAHAREKVSMSLGGKMIDAQGGRKEMLRIVENLRREGERRRSTSPFVTNVPRIE
ncbi:hypothetical protein SEPCBS119000_005360 [Sporothrix epigloea]|uniref:Ubiquitin-like protease family profile domain-containing protein n=1 Tax=Sporothrix epigloea TaxID=1892477 RepID=A0ABP0DX64_9PEZI